MPSFGGVLGGAAGYLSSPYGGTSSLAQTGTGSWDTYAQGSPALAGMGGGGASVAQMGGASGGLAQMGGGSYGSLAQMGGGGGGLAQMAAGYGGSTLASPGADPAMGQQAYSAGQAAWKYHNPTADPLSTSPTSGTSSGVTGWSVPGDVAWGAVSDGAIEAQLGIQGSRNTAITAADIQDLGKRYGVPVAVIVAILGQESSYGTAPGTLKDHNNFFGLTVDPGTPGAIPVQQGDGSTLYFGAYATAREGLEAAVKNMASPKYQNLTLAQYLGLYLTGNVNGTTDRSGNRTDSYVQNAIAVARSLGLTVGPDTVVTKPGAPTATGDVGKALQVGSTMVGNTPYQLGGRRASGKVGPGIGIDCSEFTAYLAEQMGVTLTWNAQAQYNQTQRVDASQLQPGDLVFFTGTDPTNNQPVTHVGMYVGGGRMINSQDGGVMYADLNSPYWREHFYGYGRIYQPPAAPAAPALPNPTRRT